MRKAEGGARDGEMCEAKRAPWSEPCATWKVGRRIAKGKGGIVLTYSFEDRGGESLYGHLYRCIRRDIESGAIPAHANLPS